MMCSNTYSRLQFSNLIPGLAEFLQHLMQLVLHALTINLFILKVLGRELDLGRGGNILEGQSQELIVLKLHKWDQHRFHYF